MHFNKNILKMQKASIISGSKFDASGSEKDNFWLHPLNLVFLFNFF